MLIDKYVADRIADNAERMLEHQVLGWMAGPMNNTKSPFPLQPLIDKVKKIAIKEDMRCEMPDPESGGITIKLNELSKTGAYGTLNRKLAQLIAQYNTERNVA